MPDYTLISMAQCAGPKYFRFRADDGRRYVVGPFGSETEEPRCDCDYFKIGRGCRHLWAAQERFCDYHELTYGPPPDGVCPLCGAGIEIVMVAV
jgi:hypothetical protein